MSLNLPLTAFQQYFDLTLPKYNSLSPTEKGIVLTLVNTYPDKFKYKSIVNTVRKITPVTANNTPTISPLPNPSTVRRRMMRRPNMRKKMLRRINHTKKKETKD